MFANIACGCKFVRYCVCYRRWNVKMSYHIVNGGRVSYDGFHAAADVGLDSTCLSEKKKLLCSNCMSPDSGYITLALLPPSDGNKCTCVLELEFVCCACTSIEHGGEVPGVADQCISFRRLSLHCTVDRCIGATEKQISIFCVSSSCEWRKGMRSRRVLRYGWLNERWNAASLHWIGVCVPLLCLCNL